MISSVESDSHQKVVLLIPFCVSMHPSLHRERRKPPTARGASTRATNAHVIHEHDRTFGERDPRPGEPPISDSNVNMSATLPCLQGNVARVGGGAPSFFPSPPRDYV